MRCHSQGIPGPGLARTVIASALLIAVVGAVMPVAALAQSRDITTTAVVAFEDRSGRNSPLLQVKAKDAVAMALQESHEFLVTADRDVEREIRSLGLTTPLSLSEAIRLGRRLDVNSVTTGEILEASVDGNTGKASMKIEMRMADVAAEEYLDGGMVSVETKATPGWEGNEADALNAALRDASEAVVRKMLSGRVPRGTVEMVLPSGKCEIGLGSQNGVQVGMKMVVMRAVYISDIEKVVMRKVGRIEVSDTQPDICYADPIDNIAPRTADHALRLYEPIRALRPMMVRKKQIDLFKGGAALALLLGLTAVGLGTNHDTPSPTPISYLHQTQHAGQPVIRVQFPDRVKGFGHLLFRGNTAGFPAPDPDALMEVYTRGMGEMSILYMDDQPGARIETDVTIQVNFWDEDGDPDTEDVDITYLHTALVAGQAYYHKHCRVTTPQFPPGTNPPLSQTGTTDGVAQNTIDQGAEFPMISEPTAPAGPVTYILPVQLVSPSTTAAPQSTTQIDFEWQPTTGADEYIVQVFPENDPNGVGTPRFHREGVRPRGTGTVAETWNPGTGDIQGDSRYFWRVGARRSSEIGANGQGMPRVAVGSVELTGWVLSEMRSFATAPTPPPPVTSGDTEPVVDPVIARALAGARGARADQPATSRPDMGARVGSPTAPGAARAQARTQNGRVLGGAPTGR